MSERVERHGLLAGFDQNGRQATPAHYSLYYLDPFRTLRWANAPGMDQMGDCRFHLSMCEPHDGARVWLEGFHSHGWGMTLEHQLRLLYEWGREGANLYLPHGMYYAGRGSGGSGRRRRWDGSRPTHATTPSSPRSAAGS